MSSPTLLSQQDIREHLKTLSEWSLENNKIVRHFQCDSFLRGIEFINAVAHLAERQNHHPDIDIRYTQITVRYWTHSANGLTALDIAGANEVQHIYNQFKKLALTQTS